MRLTLSKLSEGFHALGFSSKFPGNVALRKKYNYSLRVPREVDDVHGYGLWILKNKMGEMWPLVLCFAIYGSFASYIFWWQFQKHEVQLNRFSKLKPWDWERSQHRFEKRHKAFYNDAAMWPRIPELDKLQAEMMEEKNKRLAAAKSQGHGHH